MTVRFVVSGIVQGVGFRWFTVRRATGLGLTGFVRNLADGRVEVVAAGDSSTVGELEAALRVGPRSAQVASVEKAEILDEVDMRNSFDIR
jgi:acylphosphatase